GPMRICYGCGSQINGKHYVSHSRKKELFFCSGCQQSLPACENCGMPVKLAGPKLPTVYCSFCRMTKECDCCSARITSKDSYRVDHVKGCFCHSCFNDRDRCVVCQTVIIPEDGGFLAGGRLVCLSCHDRNISLTEARTLNAGVIHFLNKEFSISDIIDCPILLVNYNVINRPNLVPALSRFLRGSEKPVLAMYEGITREKAVAVSAYEYGKYIVNRLNPSVADGELKESFAIWVMAYVLREYGELDELSAVKKRIETDGILKSLMNIERLAGLGRVVEKLKLGEIGRK
ncbi:MAG: hypothetical protein OEZ36_01435, partial [Spirochaetota bacterium]|nr:hypothetical protein [Spirochaetota bacterium]